MYVCIIKNYISLFFFMKTLRSVFTSFSHVISCSRCRIRVPGDVAHRFPRVNLLRFEHTAATTAMAIVRSNAYVGLRGPSCKRLAAASIHAVRVVRTKLAVRSGSA